ncbi:MAG: 4'-phosphopantetheinyl transferase superfamily protein [Duncaniella sp.]|nr:4'-phosphopantetheinyl transferase superfamily protein [Duncaniella sp.]
MKLYRRPLPDISLYDSRGERDRAATMALLKEIFGNDVEYSHRPSGAPVVACNGMNHNVSLSHSCSTIVIAVAGDEKAIGVDVETYREQLERVQSKYLSDEERKLFTAPIDKLKAWTAKEAVYKAALTPGLSLLEIDCTRISDGIVTARGISYNVTYPAAALDETIAIAIRDK